MHRSTAARRHTRERDVFGRAFRATCNDLLITYLLTRPRTPRLGCRADLPSDFVPNLQRAARSPGPPLLRQDLAKAVARCAQLRKPALAASVSSCHASAVFSGLLSYCLAGWFPISRRNGISGPTGMYS